MQKIHQIFKIKRLLQNKLFSQKIVSNNINHFGFLIEKDFNQK